MKLWTILLLLFSIKANSQTPPPWEWARTTVGAGVGNGWQESYSIASDKFGNIYLSGFFGDPILIIGSYTLTNNGTNNVLIAKYDSAGNVLWAKSSYGLGDNEVNSIAVDRLGNSYMTGQFASPYIVFDSDTLFTSGSGVNIFVVKYDSSGNEVWALAGIGTGSNIGRSIACDTFGNIYLTGIYNAPILVFNNDTLTNTAPGFTDMFILKLDTLGNITWAKNFSGNWAEFSTCIYASNSGNIYFTGQFSSPILVFDNDTLSATGPALNVFIAKLNSSGNVLWDKSYPADVSFSITEDAFSYIYFTGNYHLDTLCFDTDTLFNSGGTNTYLTKLDSNGNVIWAKSSVNTGAANSYCIISDSAGNVFISGGFGGTSSISFDSITLQFPSNGFDPMFIVKYDSSGNAVWGKAEASGGDDVNSLAFGKNGSIYFGGDFYNVNQFILGCDTLIRTSSESVFVAKLGTNLCPDSIESLIDIQPSNNIELFPNPFDKKLFITNQESERTEMILYDILSRKLLEMSFTSSTSINTEQLENGIYIYEVINKGRSITKGKLIKRGL